MNLPDDLTSSKSSRAISKSLPGPDLLRYYPVHQLMAWQPQGTLDDLMLDQIADWLVAIEKLSFPFTRFIDFSQLTRVAVRTSHVFKVARRRAQQFAGVWPVRTALFADDWVAFGVASMYESLMEDTLIEARAFRDLATAADWLAVPVLSSRLRLAPRRVKYSEVIADNLTKAGGSWGCASPIDSSTRTI